MHSTPASEARQPAPGMLEVIAPDAGTADQEINDAIARVTEAAAIYGTGVLVTRVSTGHYIIRAHPAVPV
ncbi:MAG: hypothetical protein ACLGIS_13985, partial [Actinomycetes bacterium]